MSGPGRAFCVLANRTEADQTCSSLDMILPRSGLAETSLVTGTLRRMQRLSFASICLEYRTFASGRFSASTGSSEGPWGGGSATGASAHGAFDGAANAMATTNHTAKSATTNTATTAAHLKFIEVSCSRRADDG